LPDSTYTASKANGDCGRFLKAHINTRVGGFLLEKGMDAVNPKTRSTVSTYRLIKETA